MLLWSSADGALLLLLLYYLEKYSTLLCPVCLETDHPLTLWATDRYSGVILGPFRFTHIEDCTRQVCDQIVMKDEIDDSIATLTNLDLTLAALRIELEALRRRPPPTPSSSTLPLSEGTVVITGVVEATADGEPTSASQPLPP